MATDIEDTLPGYQQAARSLAVYPGQGENFGLLYATLGLANVAGELANEVKKIMRDGAALDTQDKIIAKLGDALWHVASLASELDTSLGDVAELNLDKLRARFDAGTLRGDGDDC